jgi:uncharacterized protein YceH (UPF0502 family)
MDEVEGTLQQLAQREPPLARALPRERGSRELRYVHLLSPVPDVAAAADSDRTHRAAHSADSANEGTADRIASLESEVTQLRARIASLEDKLAQLIS